MSTTLNPDRPYMIAEASAYVETAPSPLRETLKNLLRQLGNVLREPEYFNTINVFFPCDFHVNPFPDEPYIFNITSSHPGATGELSLYVYDTSQYTVDCIPRDENDIIRYYHSISDACEWLIPYHS